MNSRARKNAPSTRHPQLNGADQGKQTIERDVLGNVLSKTASDTRGRVIKESITPLKGVLIGEMKRCGKLSCHCASGHLHGPYHYHYYREAGRLRKHYIKPENLAAVSEGIEARKRVQRERRVARWQIQRMIAELKQADLW